MFLFLHSGAPLEGGQKILQKILHSGTSRGSASVEVATSQRGCLKNGIVEPPEASASVVSTRAAEE